MKRTWLVVAGLLMVTLLVAGCGSSVVSTEPATDSVETSVETVEPTEPARLASAPDFTLPDLEGQRWTLSQFRGQPVMLFFWATW